MKKKMLGAVFFAIFFLFTFSGLYAANYVNWYNAVDSKEIRWGGSTAYSTEWNAAVSTWNALGEIDIGPDGGWTFQDLSVSDVDEEGVIWAGKYDYSPLNSDSLKLNKSFLKNYTSSQKQMVTSHELGHALGLDDSIIGNLMYWKTTTQTSLRGQDKADYEYLWSNQ